jgi:magnesium chelatase family protein
VGFAQVLSRAQLGLEAPLVRIEAHIGPGLPGFSLVGLPAPVVRESRERVRSAILNAGFEFPSGRITVNLAPVELAKEGGRYDLPVALALLQASGQLRLRAGLVPECFGELGLDAALRPVRGLLMAAVQAAHAGHALVLATGDLAEVRLAGHREAYAFDGLAAACAFLGGSLPAEPDAVPPPAPPDSTPDGACADPLADVRGQWQAKRALHIAATGGHSRLLVGPPGCGKSMLASRLPLLLPPLAGDEAMQVASIASLGPAGFDPAHWGRRPFRAPHHAASANAIVGGGSRLRAGEISLAHHGVLFLDELPEFDRRVLEALREPLESGVIHLARTSGSLCLPAQFQLVAAMNPCPCGYHGDATRACRCGPRRIERYRQRVSGPLLDRIDLHLALRRAEAAEITSAAAAGAGALPAPHEVQCSLQRARARQAARQGGCNAHLDQRGIAVHCRPDAAGQRLYERVAVRLGLSARACHRLLRVARSIADLADAEQVGAGHIAEAASLRMAQAGGACEAG